MNDSSANVCIVDDDEAVLDALGFLMRSVGLKYTVFASAQAFLDVYDDNQAGCLVCDIRMPGMSGLDLQDELIKRQSLLPILFITGHGDIPMAVQAIQKGAENFLTKPFRDQELLDCIKLAMQKDAEHRSLYAQKAIVMQCLSSLSSRERQVLDQVVAGASNKEIALALHLSHRTVEVHRSRVMEKMQARSLAQLLMLMQLVQQ